MELVQLQQSNMTEIRRFNNYSMMAWNIGYPKSGDFQYRSYDVKNTLESFKKGHIVGNTKDRTVMQITETTLSMDNKGIQYVELKGETPLNIFDFRPAVKEILSIEAYEAEYPDGWFYGDDYSHLRDVIPLEVAKDVISTVDRKTYGQPKLSYLQLPFVYIDDTDRSLSDGLQPYEGEKLAYYQPSGSVGDTLEDLCVKGEFGMVVMRPDYTEMAYEPWVGEERYLGCYFYRPAQGRYNDLVTFKHSDDDMLGSEATYRLVENVYIESTEDYVLLTSISQDDFTTGNTPPVGLTARVNYNTRKVQDLTGVAYTDSYVDFAKNAGLNEKDLLSMTLETNGRFTYSPKHFEYGVDLPGYFLGDRVSVMVKGMASSMPMRVKNFIRTQDMNGYREYPEFELDVESKMLAYFEAMVIENWN